jgi:hypothetical protein
MPHQWASQTTQHESHQADLDLSAMIVPLIVRSLEAAFDLGLCLAEMQ